MKKKDEDFLKKKNQLEQKKVTQRTAATFSLDEWLAKPNFGTSNNIAQTLNVDNNMGSSSHMGSMGGAIPTMMR
ncbi:hypothetical protein Ciccas_004275 [Cichlidogyrus casuarinus]|uniref:Uncharacterized protein n=1 Tax=Cichlidogyrus casuarinus TaxID=1844966 RepID=A0ABD2QBZ8_9PLAT